MSEADKKLADETAAAIAREVPTNWLDSLLTGSDAVIGNPPFGCPDIENLLRAIKQRVSVTATSRIAEALSAQREALPKEPTFEQGYVLAVAEIIRTHGNTTVARDVLRGIGEVDWSTVDEADIKTLTEAGLVMKAPKRRQGK